MMATEGRDRFSKRLLDKNVDLYVKRLRTHLFSLKIAKGPGPVKFDIISECPLKLRMSSPLGSVTLS